MNGIEALGPLRADPRTRDIPVIAVTASAMPQDRQKILAAGFDGYQSKPINVKEFVTAVREMLKRTRRGGGTMIAVSPAKILVVDDTPRNVKFLVDLLGVKGYSVVTASSGAEALAQVAGRAPGPGAARRRHAGHERVRGVPADPRQSRVPASCRW